VVGGTVIAARGRSARAHRSRAMRRGRRPVRKSCRSPCFAGRSSGRGLVEPSRIVRSMALPQPFPGRRGTREPRVQIPPGLAKRLPDELARLVSPPAVASCRRRSTRSPHPATSRLCCELASRSGQRMRTWIVDNSSAAFFKRRHGRHGPAHRWTYRSAGTKPQGRPNGQLALSPDQSG